MGRGNLDQEAWPAPGADLWPQPRQPGHEASPVLSLAPSAVKWAGQTYLGAAVTVRGRVYKGAA